MADFSQPTPITGYLSTLDILKARDVDAITLCLVDPTSIPTGAMKFVRGVSARFQEYNGAAFADAILSIAGGGTGATTASGARTALGLGTIAVQNANAVAITGGTLSTMTSIGTGDLTVTGATVTAGITASGVVTVNNTFNVNGGMAQALSINGTSGLSLSNINAGTSAHSALYLGNSLAFNTRLLQMGANWTTSSYYKQDGTVLEALGAGGLSIAGFNATTFWSNNTHRMRVQTNGFIGIGPSDTNFASCQFEIQSQADGIGSNGLRISRSDGSYGIFNYYISSQIGLHIQAGDGGVLRSIYLNPQGSNVYMSANRYLADSTAFSPDLADLTYNLGSSSKRWLNVYTTNVNSGSTAAISMVVNGSTQLSVQNGLVRSNAEHEMSANVVPTSDNGCSAGRSGRRFTEVWAVNGTIQTSDRRMKKDIIDCDYGLDFINKLRPVEYSFVHDAKRHLGLIAQDLLALDDKFPAVNQDDPANLAMSYVEMLAPVIRAIQELDAKLTSIQKVH